MNVSNFEKAILRSEQLSKFAEQMTIIDKIDMWECDNMNYNNATITIQKYEQELDKLKDFSYNENTDKLISEVYETKLARTKERLNKRRNRKCLIS